jgi:hypothetical protein
MQARSMQAPAVHEIGFSQPGSTASPRLVKAVMPGRPAQIAVRAKPLRRPAPVRNLPQPFAQDPYTPHQGQWILLTEWSDGEAPPRLVLAVAESNRPSYAALPTPMGWLIVQL